jgi:hypothetical protein
MCIEFISSLYLKCEDDELESNFFQIEYSFRYHNVMGSHWEKLQV